MADHIDAYLIQLKFLNKNSYDEKSIHEAVLDLIMKNSLKSVISDR